MPKIYLTADQHFDHKNIIKYCNRPFGDINEMNAALIDNWNSVVGDSDTVYHLGDFAFVPPKQRGAERINELLDMLNGDVHLIYGNHDNVNSSTLAGFVTVVGVRNIRYRDRKFVLTHYPPTDWDYMNGCYWMFGHTHNKKQRDNGHKTFDVGVDCCNYTPILLDDVIGRLG